MSFVGSQITMMNDDEVASIEDDICNDGWVDGEMRIDFHENDHHLLCGLALTFPALPSLVSFTFSTIIKYINIRVITQYATVATESKTLLESLSNHLSYTNQNCLEKKKKFPIADSESVALRSYEQVLEDTAKHMLKTWVTYHTIISSQQLEEFDTN